MKRRADIDALRVLATYLLFVFHAAKVFDPMPFFHVRNREVSGFFYILAGFIAQWHMPLFFLLAGWSMVASLRSRGATGFLKDRVLKLGVPLVAGCLMFGAAIKYIELRSGLDLNHRGLRMSPELQDAIRPFGVALPTLPEFKESFLAFLPTYFTRLDRFTWSHLWFLAYLLVLSVVYCPLVDRIVHGRERWQRAEAFWLFLPLVPLLVIQLTLRTRFPGIYNLYNDWANIAFYSVYLLAGVFLARHAGLEGAVERTWKAMFAVGTAAMLVLLAAALQLFACPTVLLIASTVAGWCYVVTLVGFARAHITSAGRSLSYLSESAFPVYILHQPVLVFVGYWVVRLDAGIAAKFFLLVLASVGFTLALYHFVFRRVSVLRFAVGMKPSTCRVPKRAIASAALVAALLKLDVAQAQVGSPRQHLTGTLFGLGDASQTVLYRWEMDRDDAGGRWTSRYRTPGGSVAVEDEVVWTRGQFAHYSYVRQTTSESSSVERRGNRLFYTRVVDGEKDQAEEDYQPNFTVGPTVIPYVQRHWAELVGGQHLDIRYGVLDRLQSYGFELSRDAAHARNGPNSVVIRMRPTSPFIRMFVDPVYMVLSADGQMLQQLIGRMLPVINNEGQLRAVDGQLLVQPPPRKGPVHP